MSKIRTAIIATAIAALTAAGLASAPSVQAAAPNCTPDAATVGLNAVWGDPAPVARAYSCTATVFPGSKLMVTGSHGGTGGGCTSNFLFRGSNGRTYIGTAGHCTLTRTNVDGDRGEIFDRYLGARVQDGAGREIGRVEYAIQQGDFDFALIRLRERVSYDTALPHWGKVTGINSERSTAPIELRWVGRATGLGDILFARSGYAFGMPNPNTVTAFGLIAPGDSGGPVVDRAGKAIGVNVAFGVSAGSSAGDYGVQIITRLAPQLDRAAKKTGQTFTLLR